MKDTVTVISPMGRLLDPEGKWIIKFEQCRIDTSGSDPKTNIDTWGVMPDGAPSQFKSRRKVNRKSSLKTWNYLCSSGWKQIINDSDNIT